MTSSNEKAPAPDATVHGASVSILDGTDAKHSTRPAAAQPVPFSQDAVAQAFAAQHAGGVKYVSAVTTRNKWFLRYDVEWERPLRYGEEWQADNTLLVRSLILDLCRQMVPVDDTPLAREMVSADFVV